MEVRAAGAKGFGAFARDNLIAGSVVIEERALTEAYVVKNIPSQESSDTVVEVPSEDGSFRVDVDACRAKLEVLTPHRDRLMQLAYIEDEKHPMVRCTKLAVERMNSTCPDDDVKLLLICAVNSFDDGRIYVRASRLNHSCDANCEWEMREAGTLEVRTVREVEKDEELTISYLGPLRWLPACYRRQLLYETKGFFCDCPACNAPMDVLRRAPCFVCHPRERLLPMELLDASASGPIMHYATWTSGAFLCKCGARTGATEDEKQLSHRVMESVTSNDCTTWQHLEAMLLRTLGPEHGCTRVASLLFLRAQLSVLAEPRYAAHPLDTELFAKAKELKNWAARHSISHPTRVITALLTRCLKMRRS
eukprot:GEMP01032637.1.p1 GENE.GEMP01032637.1~~GEMP01032637.1.p1  ORF type:complete len:364 (+),score=90.47 GEMP01032637.1:35-1126(+)